MTNDVQEGKGMKKRILTSTYRSHSCRQGRIVLCDMFCWDESTTGPDRFVGQQTLAGRKSGGSHNWNWMWIRLSARTRWNKFKKIALLICVFVWKRPSCVSYCRRTANAWIDTGWQNPYGRGEPLRRAKRIGIHGINATSSVMNINSGVQTWRT